MNNFVLVYASHITPQNDGYRHFLKCLASFRDIFSTIYFVYSRDPSVTESVERIVDECQHVSQSFIPIELPNIGYDTAKWYHVTQNVNCSRNQYYCLMNDTCELVQPLKPVIDSFLKKRVNVFGLTDSNERAYHIQSYFRIFDARGLELFNRYCQLHNSVLLKDSTSIRQEVIDIFEIQFCSFLLKHNATRTAFILVNQLKIPNKTVNVSLLYPNLLISRKCPLIKRVVTQNAAI